ncbi:thiamine-phosphate kinase [bacterium K02(2017)]|nr:thiamine-phosphate kinase [bacterium K02(2017)]
MISSEFDLIKKIKLNAQSHNNNLVMGIGDDCAVLEKDQETYFLVSTDCLIESIHFNLRYFSFKELGQKAAAVNFSDIAAMGGTPLHLFISLGIPKTIDQNDIQEFYLGLNDYANKHHVTIAGGDLSKSPKHFFININIIGEVKKDNIKLRSQAKAEDKLYVSGNIGSSFIGLKLLERKHDEINAFTKALKTPQPPVNFAQKLSTIRDVHAMIDISDGLIQDLSHILNDSKLGAIINFDEIPTETDFKNKCKKLRLNVLESLLTGGEDYQLLFSMSKKGIKSLSPKEQNQIFCIGKLIDLKSQQLDIENYPYPNIIIRDQAGGEYKLDKTGWDHFGR